MLSQIAPNAPHGKYYRVLNLGPNQNTQGTTCSNCANWWLLGGPSQGNLWSGWTLANFDVGASAPYFEDNIPDAWGSSALLGKLFTQIETGGQLPIISGANTTTNSGNAYSVTSSSACGNGAIPSVPANGTATCFKTNVNNTGNTTLSVDGGPAYPLYWPLSAQNNITSFQMPSGTLSASSPWMAVFTTTTGAAAWSSATTYSAGFPVTASDGNTYYSIAGSNTNINPVGDGGVHWQALTPAWWFCPNCGGAGNVGMIVGSAIPVITQTLATMASNSVSFPLICYESGEQILNIGDTFTYYTMLAAIQDNRWLAVYNQYYSAVKAAGLTGVCNHFNDIGANIFGTWGYNPQMYTANGLSPAAAKQQSLYNYIRANPKVSLP
jgi:hypothetical protein